jgi:magnesium-protoporphyrin IX monomethyl ester (oxidative) cyclase
MTATTLQDSLVEPIDSAAAATARAKRDTMGLDSTTYDAQVFRITSEISRQVFPLTLDTDGPAYRAGLERMHQLAETAIRAKQAGGVLNLLKRGVAAVSMAFTFVKLLLVPVIPHELPEQVRVVPRW